MIMSFFSNIKNRDFALRTMQRLFNELLNISKLKKSNLNEINLFIH